MDDFRRSAEYWEMKGKIAWFKSRSDLYMAKINAYDKKCEECKSLNKLSQVHARACIDVVTLRAENETLKKELAEALVPPNKSDTAPRCTLCGKPGHSAVCAFGTENLCMTCVGRLYD